MKRLILVLSALTLLFGMQAIRILLPWLIWYGSEELHMSLLQIVLIAFAPFIVAMAAPLLVRLLKPRGALWVAGAGLALSRLVEQLRVTGSVEFGAALIGITCFASLLPLLLARARAEGEEGVQMFTLGLLLGLSVDTALRGLTGTIDLTWISGPWPWLTVIALVGAFGFALWNLARTEVRLLDTGWLASLPLLGLGPLLFVESQILQNQGWVTTLTGWSPGEALGWITIGNVGGLLAAAYTLTNTRLRRWWWWSLLPGGLLALGLVYATVPGWTSGLGVLLGVVSAAALLSVVAGDVQPPRAHPGAPHTIFALELGLLLFATLVTLYYFSFLASLAPIAAGGLTLCAVGAARLRVRMPSSPGPGWRLARWSVLLLLAPLAVLLNEGVQVPRSNVPHGYPVRVMTYNIRSAYGMDGRQDVEAIARVIEGAGTDVVVLEELSRGWSLTGGTDLLAVLSRRLNMPYTAMEYATDPIYGEAILSRYPILSSGWDDLPRLGTPIGRGYVWATIDLGAGEKLQVFGTHLEPSRADVTLAQAQALLKAWGGQPQTVFAGDMNSVSGSPVIQQILGAGLVDAWSEAGHGARPLIDWIFHSAGLATDEVEMIESPASDHPALVATISLAP